MIDEHRKAAVEMYVQLRRDGHERKMAALMVRDEFKKRLKRRRVFCLRSLYRWIWAFGHEAVLRRKCHKLSQHSA